ncbi:MAG TPA: hypothetical protein VEK38_02045 [Candidatus Bathyarchaeia archaeon]|nr:hypothetical protein [Candidatus Bathyarchaeia archaeon]
MSFINRFRFISTKNILIWIGVGYLTGLSGTVVPERLFIPSYQEVCNTTYTVIHDADKLYGEYCDQIQHAHNIHEKYDEEMYVDLKESLLRNIATDLCKKRNIMYDYVYNFARYNEELASTIYRLREQRKILCRYIENLENKHPDPCMLERLRKAKKALKKCTNRTSLVSRYFSYHESYFNLFAITWTLFNHQYPTELQLIDIYCTNNTHCILRCFEEKLKAFIRHKSSCTYPFINYVNLLDKFITELETGNIHLTRNYKNLSSDASYLTSTLRFIRFVLTDALQEDYQKRGSRN